MLFKSEHRHTSAQVRFDNVSVHYLDKPAWLGGKTYRALDSLCVNVDKENLAIVGPSGAGKSTIVELLFGLKSPTSGEVYVCNQPLSRSTRRERRALCQHIQLIPQEPSATLNPYYTVAQVVAEPLLNLTQHGLGNSTDMRHVIASKVKQVMDEVGLSESLLQHKPNQLSVGQAQRVAIARALIVEPCVLVADEPTSSLDPISRQKIIDLLKRLQRQRHMRLILVTHDLRAAKELSDHTLVLHQGKVVERGQTSVLLSQPQHPVTQGLLGKSSHDL